MPKKTKQEVQTEKKSYGNAYSIIGDELQQYCGEFTITKDTFYNINERSGEAQAYKTKIVNWIGKGGLRLKKNGQVYDNQKELDKVTQVFKDTTRTAFKDKYFTNHFCSGDIYMYPKKNSLNEITCQIVDSRTVKKNVDSYGTVLSYSQMAGTNYKQIPYDGMYNSIVRYDPNNPSYGKSLYKSIVYDALSDKESSQRQFYFFKNNAVPNAVFMLDPNITNPEIIKGIKEDLKTKYSGSTNAHKSIVSSGITDVKLLELSNKDLDLLNLRKFVILKMGILFQIDPRIIGFMTEAGADRSIGSIRKEAGETINNLAMTMENDINEFYKQFVNPKMDYEIKLDNESFEDREVIEENQRKDIQLGLLTINEVREERDLEIFGDDNANKPLVASNMTFLDQLGNQFTL